MGANDQYKQTLFFGGFLMALVITAVMVIHYLMYLEIYDVKFYEKIKKIILYFHGHQHVIRFFMVGAVFTIAVTAPNFKINRGIDKQRKYRYRIIALISSSVLIMGYTPLYFYNVFVFPFMMLFSVYWIYRAAQTFRKTLVEESMFNTVSNVEQNEYSFSFNTDKGTLTIHNPFQGIYIEGGPGSGKSGSWVDSIIHQSAIKGYSAMIYDYKGNPTTLGLTAYNSIKKATQDFNSGKSKIKPAKFSMVNFADPLNSAKVNPLDPKNISSALFASELGESIMKNLKKEWVEKADFWADNAITTMAAAIWSLRNRHPNKCTLPHVISLCLQNYEYLLQWLAEDQLVRPMMMPLIVAHEKNAEGQLAGVVASLQNPLAKLYSEEVFYIMGPSNDEKVLDLDISDPDNPTFLTICNDPKISSALSPAISCIISIVIANINTRGKNKTLFCVDELPTIYIKNLDNLPATGRSNKVVTALFTQDRAQNIRDYGEKDFNALLGSLGTQAVGMTNNPATARAVSDMFGTIKKTQVSITNSSGNYSENESLRDEKALQPRDIAGQSLGEFTGKIADGEPPFFKCKMPFFDHQDPANYRTYYQNVIREAKHNWQTGSESEDRQLLNGLIKENFQRINLEVQEILADSIAEVNSKKKK